MKAEDVVRRLDMQPHPEGGWYRETFRDQASIAGRARSTAIYYLLARGQRSHWHRVDAVETWHFYAGDALSLFMSHDGETVSEHRLGPDLMRGHRPQIVIPQGVWQAAEPHGADGPSGWTLTGCTVAPGFEFAGFEMAPPDWAPGK